MYAFCFEKLPKEARDELYERLRYELVTTPKITLNFIREIGLEITPKGHYKISHTKLKKAIEDRIKKEKRVFKNRRIYGVYTG